MVSECSNRAYVLSSTFNMLIVTTAGILLGLSRASEAVIVNLYIEGSTL